MKLRTTAVLSAILLAMPAISVAQQAATSPSERPDLRALSYAGVSARNPEVAMQLKNAKAQFEVAQETVDEDATVAAKLRATIRERTGLPSSAGLQPLVAELQLSLETLQQEEAAAAGRRAGLEAAIAQWIDRAKAQAVDDPALKELEIVAEKQERNAARQKALIETHSISQDQYDESVTALAISKAKIAGAQRRVLTGANEAVDAWNRELMNLNIAAQERAARLKYIEGRLKTLEPALDDLDHLESATARLHAAEQDLRVARQRYEEGRRLFPDSSTK